MELIRQRRAVIQYVRDKKRRPVGVIVVYKSNKGGLKVGYSRCRKGDRFDKEAGLHIALQRAIPVEQLGGPTGKMMFATAPTGYEKLIRETISRANAYFRVNN